MSREEVIRRIVQREQQKLSLVENVVLQEDAALHQAACDHFGTWQTVLRYAGINWKQVAREEHYSPDKVKRELRCLCFNGYRITARYANHRNNQLYRAALQHFGSWRRAVRAAGINPDHIGRADKSLDKQRIIQILISRKQRGLTLDWQELCCENHALALLAKSRFSGWAKALVAAGIRTSSVRRRPYQKWSREKIVAAIQKYHQQGLPTQQIWKTDKPLTSAAVRYFGNLHEALAAAGLVAEGTQKSSQDEATPRDIG